MSKVVRTTGLCALLLASVACERQTREPAQPATETSDHPGEGAEIAAWPDGWMVVSEHEWLPVLDDTGRSLREARAHIMHGERVQAASSVREAIAHLDARQAGQAPQSSAFASEAKPGAEAAATASEAERERVARAAVRQQLATLAGRLEGEQTVSLADVDRAIAEAYRNNVALEWMNLLETHWAATFERPHEHLQNALLALGQGNGAEAATEIQRGAAFLYLASRSAEPEDRDALADRAQELAAAAQRAQNGGLTPDALRSLLVTTDNSFAESYLREAERAFHDGQLARARRALHEARARLSSSARWLGEEASEATGKLLGDLETLASEVDEEGHVAKKQLDAALRRARAWLQKRAAGKIASGPQPVP